MTGQIPREIGRLPKIYHINLHSNNLTGEIPREIANLFSLISIDPDRSELSLELHNNRLTGEIPRELARFEDKINPQQGGVNLPIQTTPVPALPALALLILGSSLGVIGLWRTRRAARGNPYRANYN